MRLAATPRRRRSRLEQIPTGTAYGSRQRTRNCARGRARNKKTAMAVASTPRYCHLARACAYNGMCRLARKLASKSGTRAVAETSSRAPAQRFAKALQHCLDWAWCGDKVMDRHGFRVPHEKLWHGPNSLMVFCHTVLRVSHEDISSNCISLS